MISSNRVSSPNKPPPGRQPSMAAIMGEARPSQAFPRHQGGSVVGTIADHGSSSGASDQNLVQPLNALGEWSCSSNPTAFLQTIQRVMFSHPVIYQVPSLNLAMAHSYLLLGDLSSCLRHLLEAQRLILVANHRRESLFVQSKISSVAYALAVTARTENKDPVKCLMYLNLVSEDKYRIAVTLQTAHCLLMMDEVEAALPLFLDLAELTRDPDIVLVCARIYATLHQLPAMCAVLNDLRSFDPKHPGIPDLDAMLHVQVDHYQVEATKLSYLRQYNDVLQVLQLGLELVPTHPELLMLKAETLFALGNPDHLLEFLASWPSNVPTAGKIARFKVAALEKLLHHNWFCANYRAALSTLDRLRAARPEAIARDRLWNCQLRFLAFGLDGSANAVDASANKAAESGMRLLEQDLLQYLTDCMKANAASDGSADEVGTAEALLCQVYARRARQVLAKGSTQGQGPDQWRAGLKLLDKAIDTSFPRISGLGDPDLPPFPELLSLFPKSVPLNQYPLWAQALPVDCQAAALWLEKSRVLEKLAETDRAIAAARAALVLVPGNLEVKQWLLQLTGDQDELAQLAAVQVAQLWTKEASGGPAEPIGGLPTGASEKSKELTTVLDEPRRPSPPLPAANSVPSSIPAVANTNASANVPATTLSAAQQQARAPSRKHQRQQPTNPASSQPTQPPKQPSRSKAEVGSNPSSGAASVVASSDAPPSRRAQLNAGDATLLPAVLVGTRVSVTSNTSNEPPSHQSHRQPALRQAPNVSKAIGYKHLAACSPPQHALTNAADNPGPSIGHRRALGPPAALSQSISKHYQALLGQYGISGAPEGESFYQDVLVTSGTGAPMRNNAADVLVPTVDIAALASDGPAAAAYVTLAVEEKVKREMVQAHQMAELQQQQHWLEKQGESGVMAGRTKAPAPPLAARRTQRLSGERMESGVRK